MKNTLTDLNNHLFEQLERLQDEEKCFKRLKGTNVGGSRIGRGEIIFDPDGLLK